MRDDKSGGPRASVLGHGWSRLHLTILSKTHQKRRLLDHLVLSAFPCVCDKIHSREEAMPTGERHSLVVSPGAFGRRVAQTQEKPSQCVAALVIPVAPSAPALGTRGGRSEYESPPASEECP